MTVAPPTAARTLVVMLGASEFPGDPALSNQRFKVSAGALREYFQDPRRFGLPESNLLWLFDSGRRPTDLNDEVESFISAAMQRPPEQRPLDVIIYYVGHGFFGDDKGYYLATRSLKRDHPEYSYRFKALQRTIKEQARFARKFYILDACFSGAAAKEMMGTDPVARRVITEVEREARDDLPERGTAVLCAAGPEDVALAPNVENYTMFTGALLDVLEKPEIATEILSLQEVHSLIDDVIKRRFGAGGVRPQIHVPEQKQGNVGSIPLFPVHLDGAGGAAAELVPSPGVRDAFDPTIFTDEVPIHAVVVGRVGGTTGVQSPLTDEVRIAWENFSPQITAAANNCRAGWRLPPVPTERPDGGFMLSQLAIERAFESEESLRRAIVALCRAEVAVFDLTDWDAGATFLLGIRAVARRGITVSSVGGEFTIGDELAVPFNLQLLNLSAHSDAQQDKGVGLRPWELLGGKIANGFRDLANLPHYLDLPAYDSVRQLGVESAAYRPVQFSERVLVLCPFGRDYTRNNWRRLEKELPGKLKQRILKTTDRIIESPVLVRLLDLKTPRLVAQTLFESIRLTDMCLVDWTHLRPNVIFEAGVRMATNPLGAVHIIEQGDLDQLCSATSTLSGHVRDILRLFDPVPYRPGPGDTSAYDKMISRFEASLEANRDGDTNFVYKAVGEALDHRSQPVALPLADELVRSANILESDDQESTGISPVLYHEVNRALVAEAREAAAERRLAAWLYLSRRWQPDEIAMDTRRLEQFELLSTQVRRWARKAERDDLLQEIATRLKLVKDATGEIKT